MLERVGKETIELLMTETGFDVDNDAGKVDKDDDEEQFEEVTFDRCFYIYGGPDLLEVYLYGLVTNSLYLQLFLSLISGCRNLKLDKQ